MLRVRSRLGLLLACTAVALSCAHAPPPRPAPHPTTATTPSAHPLAATPSAAAATPAPALICPGPPVTAPAEHARQMLQGAHVYGATAVAMSRGPWLATASQFDSMLRVWDVPHRALVGAFHVDDFGANLVWDDPKPELSVLHSDFGEARRAVFDFNGRVLKEDQGPYLPALRSPHGMVLGALSIDSDKRKMIFTPPGGRPVTLVLPAGSFLADDEAVLSRDGKSLAMRSLGDVYVWSVASPARPPRVIHVDGEPKSLAFSPDVDSFVVATGLDASSPGYRISIVPIASGKKPVVLAESSDLFDHVDVAVSPDGSRIVAADDHGLRAWNAATHALEWSLRGHQWDPKGASFAEGFDEPVFSADGRVVVAQVQNGPLTVVDATSGRAQGRMGEPVRAPTKLAWAADGKLVAGSHGHIAVWDTRSGAVTRAFDVPDLLTFALLPNGDVAGVRWASCPSTSASRANVWVDGWTATELPDAFARGNVPDARMGCDAKTPPASTPLAWPPAHGVAPAPLVVPGNGLKIDVEHHFAVVPSKPGFLAPNDAVLDLATGAVAPLQSLPRDVATSMSDDVVLAGGWFVAGVRERGRHAVRVWDPKSGAPIATVPATGNGVYAGMSADGRFIAIGESSHLGVYELPSGARARDVDFHDEVPAVVGFVDGPNDLYVATIARGERGNALHHLAGDRDVRLGSDPIGVPKALVASPDRKRLAVLGLDGAVRLWDTENLRLLAALAEFDDDEHIAYTPGGAYAGTAEVASRVDWIFDAPVEPFHFEQFASLFGRRDLVGRRLAGEDVDAATDLARPPRVEIESADADATAPKATLRLHVASPARVAEVRVFVEGRAVASRAVCDRDAHVDIEAPLFAGRSGVTAIAYDDRGFASNPATVDLQAAPGAVRRPDLWIVSVGVSGYPNLPPEFQLGYAEDDARGVVDAFARQAGDGKPYAMVHSTLLLGNEVTPPAVERALATLASMKEGDVALVFFAGHGEKPSADEDMLFLTSRVARSVASIRENGVGWRTIGDALAKAKGRVVVLLDACHSGDLSQDLVVPNDALASALVEGGRAGAFVFAAAKGRQSSLEPAGARGLILDAATKPLVTVPSPSGGGHGFFTGALLAALDTAQTDANNDGAIQLSELVDAVTDRVVRATRGAQSPWVARREILGDFTIASAARK